MDKHWLLFLFLYSLNTVAAPIDSLKRKQDTTYVKSYLDKLMLKMDMDNDLLRFKLSGDDFKYDIRPNLGPSRTMSFNYRWAYIGFSYLPDFILKNKWNDRRGKTQAFSMGGGITAPRFLFDLKYTGVKGFYLHNTSDYVMGWNPDSDPYIQFPDLDTWMIRGSAFYKTNPNFSVRAIQNQTEAQRKTASSLLPGIAYNYYVIDNKSQTGSSSQRSKNLMIIAQLDYYATLVLHKKWYATLGVGAGGGFNYTWLLTRQSNGNIESTQSSGVVRGFLNTGLGYNGTRFIAGAELLYHQSYSQQQKTIDLVFTRTAYQIFIGYRFNAPVFLKNSFAALDKYRSTR